MKNFRKFSSIEQFRNVIRDVAYDYKNEPTLPTLTFVGTIKVHGTNAAIGYNYETEELFAQKRNSLCTIENDNAKFAQWVEDNKDAWVEFFKKRKYPGVRQNQVISRLYGEWCGGNIQKGVAVTGLPKMFIVFKDVTTIDREDCGPFDFIRNPPMLDDLNIENVYSIYDFPIFKMEIDFNNPKLIQNKLIEITEQVEAECPVGKYFGVSGIGEGLVWSNGVYTFKTKGEKHVNGGKRIQGLKIDLYNERQIINFLELNKTKTFDYFFQ